ncbi:MAG TPA: hypothetical protein VF179_05300 [Thermoanaerobaculia bacterium]|nr:hypothetical protein [Thermoanaerobaculia bacterium]
MADLSSATANRKSSRDWGAQPPVLDLRDCLENVRPEISAQMTLPNEGLKHGLKRSTAKRASNKRGGIYSHAPIVAHSVDIQKSITVPSAPDHRWPEMDEPKPDSRVSKALFAEVVRGVDRELDSRRALNSGLQHVITFAGALLAISLALAAKAATVEVGCSARALLAIFFLGGISGLLAAIAIALFGLGPQPRALPNPDLLRFYATSGTKNPEIRADLFEVEMEAMENLHHGNERRAKCHRLALRSLILPLTCAAGGAITLFFASL